MLDSWVVAIPKVDGTFQLILTLVKTPRQHTFYKGLNRNMHSMVFSRNAQMDPFDRSIPCLDSAVFYISLKIIWKKKMRVL